MAFFNPPDNCSRPARNSARPPMSVMTSANQSISASDWAPQAEENGISRKRKIRKKADCLGGITVYFVLNDLILNLVSVMRSPCNW